MLLPKKIRVLRRQRAFSISYLALFSGCPARFILQNEGVEAFLPSGPYARLGSEIHKVIEVATREARQDVLPALRATILNGGITVHSSASALGVVPLREAFSRSHLSKKIGAANRSYISSSATRISQNSQVNRSDVQRLSWLQKLVNKKVLVEESVKSETLQLAGKIDRLELSDSDSIIVEDFKTGQICDEQEGNHALKQDYQLQLYGYALVLSEDVDPSAIMMRVVGSDRVWEEPFSGHALQKISRHVADLQRVLPTGQDLSVAELASPGDACQYCPYRPACAAYLDWAPTIWANNDANDKLPYDVWGIVNKATKGEGGLWDIYVTGDGGKSFRVNNVPDHLIESPYQEGQRVYMFSLRPTRSKQQGYPQNYEVLSREDFSRSAHTAKIFAEQG
jgi:hypothetical protein